MPLNLCNEILPSEIILSPEVLSVSIVKRVATILDECKTHSPLLLRQVCKDLLVSHFVVSHLPSAGSTLLPFQESLEMPKYVVSDIFDLRINVAIEDFIHNHPTSQFWHSLFTIRKNYRDHSLYRRSKEEYP